MDDRRLPPEHANRYSGATSQVPELDIMSIPKSPIVPTVTSAAQSPERKPRVFPWYHPQGWSRRRRIIIAAVVSATLILATVLGADLGVRANRYPDYTLLTYRLVDTYQGTSFFDKFNYFSDEDPTAGFVIYTNRSTAQDLNLTYASDTSAVLRVDSFTPRAVGGRNSVRIESKATYDTGLFLFDIIHTPYGCGTWPALWLTDGYNWPMNGEIDVLESNNEGSNGNEITLHTTQGCNMDVKRKETGSPVQKSCDNSTGNSGCGVLGDSSTYGQEFNQNGGGVYALEIRPAGIRTWIFPRAAIPLDISNSTNTPNPSTWGTALADFPSTNCDITSHFRNQSIIANIDLCGELAAQPQYYTGLYQCPGTCSDFVANNPSSFEEAFWEFGEFRVYEAIQEGGDCFGLSDVFYFGLSV